MGSFDSTPDWYELKNIAEIEDFDPDQYGNIWFNAVFVGDAATHMWLAKEKPEEGKSYYGHFDATKSGKRLRFRRDTEPEDEQRPATAPAPKSNTNNPAITLGLVWKTLIGIMGVPEDDEQFARFYELVDAHASELLLMGEKLK
jgi:hypothetical protein